MVSNMRILWFTNTPSNYGVYNNGYNGGGWISSLETALTREGNIDLGICFLLDGNPWKKKINGVIYYPVARSRYGFWGKIVNSMRIFLKCPDWSEYFIEQYMKVVDDFRPDIIHIFGTEQNFGLLAKHIDIPIVIHLQGLLIPYLNAFFPPGVSKMSYFFCDFFPLKVIKRYLEFCVYKISAHRELEIIKTNKHFLGRTEWDKSIINVFNHNSTYDYCGEILRDAFYKKSKRNIPSNLVITSTISSPLYKGIDVIGKCAAILHQEYGVDFEWRVFGNIDENMFKRKINRSERGSVRLMGVVSQDTIRQSVMESTVFVHPSYIDNSPNSVCEAQLLGCPVVAQNVGGLSSLINHGTDGMLVPANDPYLMTHAIMVLYEDKKRNIRMGELAQQTALRRHDKVHIVDELINIYIKYKKL